MAVNASAMDRTVTATVRGKFKDDYSRGLSQFRSATTKAFASIKNAAKIATIAFTAIGAGIVAISAKAIGSYRIQEDAETRMRAALIQTGEYTKSLYERYLKLASGLQAYTAVGDEVILKAQDTLIRFGGVSEKYMKKALLVTLDYAKSIGKSVPSAALDMAKAFSGNLTMLQRYGIYVDKAKYQTQGLVAVLDAVTKKTGGAAHAFAVSFSGKIQAVSDLWGDMWDEVGRTLAKAPAINMFIDKLKTQIINLTNAVIKSKDTIANGFLTIADTAISLGKGIVTFGEYVMKAIQGWTLMINQFQKAFSKLKIIDLEHRLTKAKEAYAKNVENNAFKTLEQLEQHQLFIEKLETKLETAKNSSIALYKEQQRILDSIKNTDKGAETLQKQLDKVREALANSKQNASGMAESLENAAVAAARINAANISPVQTADRGYSDFANQTPGPVQTTSQAPTMPDSYIKALGEQADMVSNIYRGMADAVGGALYDMLASHEGGFKGIIGSLASAVSQMARYIVQDAGLKALYSWAEYALFGGERYKDAAIKYSMLAGMALVSAPALGALDSAYNQPSASSSYSSSYSENSTYKTPITNYASDIESRKQEQVNIVTIVVQDPNQTGKYLQKYPGAVMNIVQGDITKGRESIIKKGLRRT